MVNVFALALLQGLIDEDYIIKYQGEDYLVEVLRAKDEMAKTF